MRDKLEELQSWIFEQRIALEPNDPDFFSKHDTLKMVAKKIREMQSRGGEDAS